MIASAFHQERRSSAPRNGTGAPQGLSPLALRVRGEYTEMPGLRLTVRQAARLFAVTPDVANTVLGELRRASLLEYSNDGTFALTAEPSRARTTMAADVTTPKVIRMSTETDTPTPTTGSLRDASLDRLASLMRHWAWADEARTAFERQLADRWDDDEDPMSDHPFGSYYQWCALLCGFSEAALEHDLLPPAQLQVIRSDLEISLPELRACRQLLVAIPFSLQGQPRLLDLLRNEDMLGRLRRIHEAFGQALREERLSREIDSLDH